MGTDTDRIEALADSYLEWLGGDVALAKELALTMLPEISVHLEKILDALAGEDAAALQASAHRLKGALGVFGEHPAFEIAQRLELCGRAAQFTEARLVWSAFEVAMQDFSLAAVVLTKRLVTPR